MWIPPLVVFVIGMVLAQLYRSRDRSPLRRHRALPARGHPRSRRSNRSGRRAPQRAAPCDPRGVLRERAQALGRAPAGRRAAGAAVSTAHAAPGSRHRSPRPSSARAAAARASSRRCPAPLSTTSGTPSSSKPAPHARRPRRRRRRGRREREHERLAHAPAAWASTSPTATAARGPWRPSTLPRATATSRSPSSAATASIDLGVARAAADERDQLAARHAAGRVDRAAHVATDHGLLGAAAQAAPDLRRQRRRERLGRAAREHAQVRQRGRRRGLPEETCASRPRGAARTASRHARREWPLGALGGVAPDAEQPCADARHELARARGDDSPRPRGADPRCRRRCRSRTASCPRAASCPAPSTGGVRLRADDVHAAGRALGEHVEQAARVASGEHRQRQRAAVLQAPAQAGILRRLRQRGTRRRRARPRAHRPRRAARVTLPGGGGAARSSSTPAVPSAKSSRTVVSIGLGGAGPPRRPRARRAPCAGPATARAACRAARASSGPRRSSSASCRGSQSVAHARPGDGDLERGERTARQDRGVGHLVDDREIAVEAVADQHARRRPARSRRRCDGRARARRAAPLPRPRSPRPARSPARPRSRPRRPARPACAAGRLLRRRPRASR